MTPDNAKFLAQVMGQQLQTEWMTTYKVLSSVPDANKDFKPQENSRTAWDLAHHIAIADVGFLHAVAANDFGVFPAKTSAKSVPELADWYKAEFPKALERVIALEGTHLNQVVSAFGGFLKLPSAAYLVFCNNHMVHHRGQLSTYLRPMGGKCPAIYGSSFDEKFPS